MKHLHFKPAAAALAMLILCLIPLCGQAETGAIPAVAEIPENSILRYNSDEGSAKLMQFFEQGNIPTEATFVYDQMGSNPYITVSDPEIICELYTLLAGVTVAGETNESITDNYHSLRFKLAEDSYVSYSFEGTKIWCYGGRNYSIENSSPLFGFMSRFTEQSSENTENGEKTSMERTLTVYYTSDIHGYVSAADGQPGLASVMNEAKPGGNTLLIDGGDILQGSPFAICANAAGNVAKVTAGLMNLAGYSFVTIGNHDFTFGKDPLEEYLSLLDATCLCANITGVKGVEDCALVTLENGLRVGVTGVITPHVPLWEKAEDLEGVSFSDPYVAAKEQLKKLQAMGADITVCICHMGFENDTATGELLSDSGENRSYQIASELGFSLVLAGHTHTAYAGGMINGTLACAVDNKAKHYIRAEIGETGTASCELIQTGTEAYPAAAEFLRPYEESCAEYLTRPIGRLTEAIPQAEFMDLVKNGCPLANLFGEVMTASTGADIASIALDSSLPSLAAEVSTEGVLKAYPFANTLTVLEVDRSILEQSIERTASFLTLDENGNVIADKSLLEPIVQYFNFDFFYGIRVTVDLSKPAGERVTSILFEGEELPADKKLSLCLNNYRASGAGGYSFYRDCPVLSAGQDDVQNLLIDYITRAGTVVTDTERYVTYAGRSN